MFVIVGTMPDDSSRYTIGPFTRLWDAQVYADKDMWDQSPEILEMSKPLKDGE